MTPYKKPFLTDLRSTKSWVSVFHDKESFLPNSSITKKISFSLSQLPFHMEKQIENIFGESILEDITSTTIPIHLLDSVRAEISPTSSVLFIVHKEFPLSVEFFMKKHFYHCLPKKILEELFLYLYCFSTIFLQKSVDFQIDLFPHHKNLIALKLEKICAEEIDFLNVKDNSPFALSWSFLSVVYQNLLEKDLLCYLEKKLIREVFRKEELKISVGLASTDFDYLEKPPSPTEENYSKHRKKYLLFEELVHNQKLSLQEYIESCLVNKKLIIWSWWTISPFITSDVSILIPSILEQKNIAAVYVDLCKSSQDTINRYLLQKSNNELEIQKEVKKIYPLYLKDFQKETLPYMILLEKLRMLQTPIQCTGINGEDISSIEPFINENNLLEYDTDERWGNCLQKELQKLSQYSQNELVIFFQFLKPMFKIPEYLTNNPFVERIIHVDKFTGFGPEKPETSLACYSRYSCENQNSFVIPNIDRSFIKDEVIVHLPCLHQKNSQQHIYIDNTKFNQFNKYNTLIYSTQSGGGGKGYEDLTPQVPSPSIYQIV